MHTHMYTYTDVKCINKHAYRHIYIFIHIYILIDTRTYMFLHIHPYIYMYKMYQLYVKITYIKFIQCREKSPGAVKDPLYVKLV
jgi:hypothetical protein